MEPISEDSGHQAWHTLDRVPTYCRTLSQRHSHAMDNLNMPFDLTVHSQLRDMSLDPGRKTEYNPKVTVPLSEIVNQISESCFGFIEYPFLKVFIQI